jgi:hypothetical protein
LKGSIKYRQILRFHLLTLADDELKAKMGCTLLFFVTFSFNFYRIKKLLEIYSKQVNIYRFTSFAKDILGRIGEIPGFGKI